MEKGRIRGKGREKIGIEKGGEKSGKKEEVKVGLSRMGREWIG